MTGIGRTPIREAIQRLSREHLILIMPQRGLLVPEIDVKKQLKLLRTRREVERLVCRSAAKSATPQERDVFAQLAAEFKEASKRNDDVSFVRLDREFNELCLIAARNEFAEAAMRLMHAWLGDSGTSTTSSSGHSGDGPAAWRVAKAIA